MRAKDMHLATWVVFGQGVLLSTWAIAALSAGDPRVALWGSMLTIGVLAVLAGMMLSALLHANAHRLV